MEETARQNGTVPSAPEPETRDEDHAATNIGPRPDLVLALAAVNQARAIAVLGTNVVRAAHQLGIPISAALYLSNLGDTVADQLLAAAAEKFGEAEIEAFLEAPLVANDTIIRPSTSSRRLVVPG